MVNNLFPSGSVLTEVSFISYRLFPSHQTYELVRNICLRWIVSTACLRRRKAWVEEWVAAQHRYVCQESSIFILLSITNPT